MVEEPRVIFPGAVVKDGRNDQHQAVTVRLMLLTRDMGIEAAGSPSTSDPDRHFV